MGLGLKLGLFQSSLSQLLGVTASPGHVMAEPALVLAFRDKSHTSPSLPRACNQVGKTDIPKGIHGSLEEGMNSSLGRANARVGKDFIAEGRPEQGFEG